MLSLRYPMEVNLVGDAKATLRELIPHLSRRENGDWRKRIEYNVERWWKVLEARAMNDAEPINPQRIFWELSPKLPDNCIITTDSGSGTNWYARDIKFRRGMMGTLSGGLATMGPAIPYAIAAKYAYPDRHVIALQGDGAFQMNGINGLITIAKGWKENAWGNGRITVMVLHNNDLNQVTWEQRVMEGDPKFEDSQNLPDFPYAGYAELLGLKGIRVDNPNDIGAAWDQAFASDVPTLIEFIADPDVPPLPPHITPDQAKHFMAALFKGDSDAMKLVRASAKEWWDGAIQG
jgi:pyruvate dehydrogenase (quinone)